MTTDFLLLAAKPGCQIPHGAADVTARGAGVAAVPVSHGRWAFDDGRVDLLVVDDSAGPPGWAEGETGRVAVFSGWPAGRDGEWSDPHAAALEEVGRVAGERSGGEESIGIAACAAIDRTGTGEVRADPMGFTFLFHGESAELSAVGTRPDLVAGALGKAGARPGRDPLAAGWLAYSRYHVGSRTGFEGVALAVPGTVFKVAPSTGLVPSVPAARPWLESDDASRRASGDVIGRIEECLGAAVARFLRIPAERHFLDLTGGRDSRLLLAVALRSGIAGSLCFRTAGPPDLPDVRIAGDIARSFGLDHLVEFEPPGHTVAYEERARAFVVRTAGLNNLWDLHTPEPRPAKLRLAGLGGEFIRSWAGAGNAPRSTAEVARRLTRRFNRLGLVNADAARLYQEEVGAEVESGLTDTATPVDALDSFQIANSQRQRLGLMERVRTDRWVLPLTDRGIVASAFSLGDACRIEEEIHREIVGTTSQPLLRMPLTGSDWPETRHSRWRRRRSSAPARDPLMARVHEAGSDERARFVLDAVSEDGSEAWSVIDRAAFRKASTRWSELSKIERQELLGAATAVTSLST